MIRKFNIIVWFLIALGCSGAIAADTLHIGIIKYKTEQEVLRSFKPLENYLGEKLETIVQVRIIKEEDLGYLVNNGQIHLGIFTPFPYLKAHLDFPKLQVAMNHLVRGQETYSGVILSRKNTGIHNLSDLRDRDFLFVKPSSTSGYKLPKGIFTEYDLDIDHGFFSYDFSGGHLLSLQQLMKGEVDGIAIDESVLNELGSSEKDSLQVLHRFDIPYHAYVFSPEIAPSIRESWIQSLENAHLDPGFRNHLKENPLGITQWKRNKDDFYNPLRRYLRIVRVKPSIHLRVDTKPSARASFESSGDILDIFVAKTEIELKQSQRFRMVASLGGANFHDLKVELFLINEKYQCQVYIDGQRIGYLDKLSMDDLHNKLPHQLRILLVKHFNITTELLYNGKDWFVTYGTNDGILPGQYDFELIQEGQNPLILERNNFKKIDELNIYLADHPAFNPGDSIRIVYTAEGVENNLLGENGESMEESFWDNRDNQWGVIGLVVAFLTLAIGSYFNRKKQRRFRSMLKECNHLLLAYIEGKYKLDNEVIAHKEKISQHLEKGHITENQYLILKSRVEDIHLLISRILSGTSEQEAGIRAEVRSIIQDGVITEKEFSRLISLAKGEN